MSSRRVAIAAGVFSCATHFCALWAQPVTSTLRFEAADVHRSPSVANPQTYRSGGYLRGARYDLRKATLLDLIRLAYGFDPDTVLGGPNWLEFDRFDVAAKTEPSTRPQELRLMLQALLADRFKLLFHRDVRPMPAFALRAGSGVKMKEAVGSDNPECRYQQQPIGSPDTVYACRNMTMAGFAQQLRAMAGDYIADPVIDSTRLAGAWDFELKWNSRSRVLPPSTERTTIFTAIDRQLGLKLAPEKAPPPVVVIDHVNETPTPNAPDIAAVLPPRELQFEVASVRQSRPDEQGGLRVTPGGGLEARDTMRNLFATAWDIHWDHVDEMILGAPKWFDTARFDVLAKPASATNGVPPPRSSFIDDDLRLMLRALLTERFHIKTHYEERPVEAYTLVSTKKTRLKKADPANRANCKEAQTLEHDPRDLNSRLSRLLACQNVTLSQFASHLLAMSPNDFAYPVIEATGIAGTWDFTLNYTPTGDRGNPEVSSVEAGPSGAMSIFEAINKQLGLKLEMRKRTLPVLVIDHIEEKPTEN